jgi:hypothetical protein
MPKQLKASEPEGVSKQARATGDENDVEGHGGKARAAEPEGVSKQARATGDENDVEGHGGKARAAEPEGVSKQARATGDEDDVEGHMFLASPSLNQEMARARERDIQRNLKTHATKDEARVHKK